MRTDLTRTRRRIVGVVILAVLATLGVTRTALAAADPCVSGNAVACENSKTGNPSSEWDLAGGAGDNTIQGFATQISVNPGATVQFKIKSTAAYSIKVYRLGYYNGLGARLQSGTISVPSPGTQPTCISDSSTQNVDCGNWSVSASWAVPSAAVSGVYVAHLVQANGDESHITFVVRDDSSHSDVIFKTSDMTWQAYNTYGGADFYTAPTSLTGSQARAFKISYNRPVATRGQTAGRDFLFSNEYPTLRFLERNGIDVSYTSDIDVSAGTTTLTNHKAFLSVGHDEYWSLPERTKVTVARDAGVNMMFLSGNEVYWHTRLEPSIDGTSTANRTLVCYKDTWETSPIDPSPEGTSTWRDPRFKAAPNASNPENALTGTLYMSNNTDLAITVSSAEGKARFWRDTTVATLASGVSATLAPHTVGYESDEDLDNGSRPAGLMRLSTTTGASPQEIQDVAGYTVAPGTTTHSLTLYRAASGSLVFGAGTIQWGWGLDQYHDGDDSNAADSRMQQATLNMLADMGSAPTTLMAGLVQPTRSTDTTAPVVTMTSPADGAAIGNGSLATVSGTAIDAGGVVTTVEVSLDGGATYHRATGTSSWSFSGVISGVGASAIKVRASDDSANLSTPVSRS
ncbi:MAG: N,N-dimethylformamidase beta subunit family domain-containing protein, partial [Lapillicoccus sp.]